MGQCNTGMQRNLEICTLKGLQAFALQDNRRSGPVPQAALALGNQRECRVQQQAKGRRRSTAAASEGALQMSGLQTMPAAKTVASITNRICSIRHANRKRQ